METGRFPDWQPERNTSQGNESKPESGKKKKRRRSDAISTQTRSTKESGSEEGSDAEHRKARKALADILVERKSESEGKQGERNRRKPAVPLDLFAGTEKKPATEAPGRTDEAKETAKVLNRSEDETYDPKRDSSERSDERRKDEKSEDDTSEVGVPRPERERLRPSELYGGEFVLDLQHNKEPDEREIPLHKAPIAAKAHADNREAEKESVLRVEHEPQDAAEEPQVETDPVTESTPERTRDTEPLSPPIYQQTAEQPGLARAYETPQPEAFVSTATPRGVETPVAGVPEADPAAANTGVAPAGFETVQAAGAVRRPEPIDVYPMFMQQPTNRGARVSNPGEPMVTKQEADDAVYYATRAAQGRGLAAGVLVAALWARHRGKKLRRQFNSRFNKQEKQLKQFREDQRWINIEQAKRQAESDRQLAAAEQRYANAERQFAARPQPESQLVGRTVPEIQSAASARPESLPTSREVTVESSPGQALKSYEQYSRGASERQRVLTEQQAQETSERLNVPPEHRLETSAWHTIEVDARTGKPVEQPTFAYGHEYYQERRHESAPASQRNAVAGEVAIVGAASAGSGGGASGSGTSAGTNGGTASSSRVPNASMQGPPPGSPAAKVRGARDNLTKTSASGPIWPLVVALLIIFVVLVVLLH